MNNNLVIIGADPGASGGLCILDHQGWRVTKMPETIGDVCEFFRAAKSDAMLHASQVKCYMEEVFGFAGEGQPGSSMFNFGRGFGRLEGLLHALEVPYEIVRPQKWQRALGVPPIEGRKKSKRQPGMSDEQWADMRRAISTYNAALKRDHKRQLKEMAERLCPSIKLTLSTCDAVLLAEYGRRQERISAVEVPQREMAI